MSGSFGRNQAGRIPVEFELPGDEAIMHRDRDRLVIEPVRKRGLVALRTRLVGARWLDQLTALPKAALPNHPGIDVGSTAGGPIGMGLEAIVVDRNAAHPGSTRFDRLD
jgi:virulence-associated protein VagC